MFLRRKCFGLGSGLPGGHEDTTVCLASRVFGPESVRVDGDMRKILFVLHRECFGPGSGT